MPAIRLCCMLLLALAITGCASTSPQPAIEPDNTVLQPAQQAIQKAVAAHVEHFAPRALDEARGRLALAQDILYLAAREGRELNDDEHQRVTGLVEGARLDARLARVKTQALAVGVKIKEMQADLGDEDTVNNGTTP